MPKKISPEMKARAVRMVLEHRDDYPSVRAAAQAVAKQLGLGPETVRRWVVDAEVDAWDPAGNHDRRAGRDQGPQGEDPPARGGQPDPACQRQAHLDPALCRQGVSFHVPSTPRRDHRCDSGLGVWGHRGLSSAFFRRCCRKTESRVLKNVEHLPCNCFVAGTAVQTSKGATLIEKVRPGDQVWAKNLTTSENEPRPVTGLFHKTAATLMTITLATGGTVVVTQEHPFMA